MIDRRDMQLTKQGSVPLVNISYWADKLLPTCSYEDGWTLFLN